MRINNLTVLIIAIIVILIIFFKLRKGLKSSRDEDARSMQIAVYLEKSGIVIENYDIKYHGKIIAGYYIIEEETLDKLNKNTITPLVADELIISKLMKLKKRIIDVDFI